MSQKTRFYLLYKNGVPIILSSFNKAWDRSNTQMKKLFWSVCWGWGLFFIYRVLQGNNLYLKIMKADKNNFLF